MCVNCKGYFMHGIGVPETIYLYFCDEWKGHYFLLLLYSQVDLLVPYFLIISTCRTLSSICKQQSKRFNRLYISCHCADTFMSIFQHLELFDSWLLVHCWCLELRSAGGPQPRCWTLDCKYLTLYVCLPLRHVQTLLTVRCWLLTSILTLLTLSTRTVNQECWST